MAGWGSGSYGGSPWGGAAAAATGMSISYAFASATHRATVVLTSEPSHLSPAALGDALNPASWAVTRTDTGAAYTVVAVAELGSLTYELSLLEPLAGLAVTHRVNGAALVDVSGNAIVAPTLAEFSGIRALAGGDAPTKQDAVVDLRYYHVSRNPIGGALNIGSDGDYQVMGGEELVRKLIIRRILTQPGEFFHLPNYGFPYAPKGIVRATELLGIRKAIRDAVAEEPEVRDAGVALTLDGAAGILYVKVQAQLQQAGETLEINTELPIGAVGF